MGEVDALILVRLELIHHGITRCLLVRAQRSSREDRLDAARAELALAGEEWDAGGGLAGAEGLLIHVGVVDDVGVPGEAAEALLGEDRASVGSGKRSRALTVLRVNDLSTRLKHTQTIRQ